MAPRSERDTHVILNGQLAPAIAARDLAAVKALIWSCYKAILAKSPVRLPQHSGN